MMEARWFSVVDENDLAAEAPFRVTSRVLANPFGLCAGKGTRLLDFSGVIQAGGRKLDIK